MIIINFIRGFFMALADSVPGVSGGTIAFIMGFYDKFINSLSTITSKKSSSEEKKTAIIFLIKIGFGWIVGMGLSVLILSSIFTTEIYKISSLFVGFILFSIPLIIVEEKKYLKSKYFNLIFTILGIITVVAITYFNPVTNSANNYSIDHLSINLLLYILLAGIIAVSAMILPGISGSTILLILGLYTTIISAIRSLMAFKFEKLPILISFGVGVILGVFLFIRLLKYLLINYRAQIIYLIIGLMLGSLYAVFMGPTTLDKPQAPMSWKTFNIYFFLIGGLLIFCLDELKKYLENKNKLSH